ncbi:MAG: hypothetical protein M0C28_48635 [Candidatus Moduliflexus flocculans]|nr:hypothetical protein [Candidatus Moduliflexus flocculans]
METRMERLWFIPGDSLLPGTANLEFFVKQRILKELFRLPADFVILDLGAGSSYNVVDFFLTSSSGLLVIQPEATSVLNAYSFLKTTVFRMLFRSFPRAGGERRLISGFASRRIEGSGASFRELARELALNFPATAPAALEQLSRFFPRVVLNEGRGPRDASMGLHLRDIVGRNLGIPLEYVGFLLRDDAVPRSVAERSPWPSPVPSLPMPGASRPWRPASPPSPAGPRPGSSRTTRTWREPWKRPSGTGNPCRKPSRDRTPRKVYERKTKAPGPCRGRAALTALSACLSGEPENAALSAPAPDPWASYLERARDIAAGLSLEAACGQLVMTGIGGRGVLDQPTRMLLAELPAGAVVLFGFNVPPSAPELKPALDQAQGIARAVGAGIPLFIAIDHEGARYSGSMRGSPASLPPGSWARTVPRLPPGRGPPPAGNSGPSESP